MKTTIVGAPVRHPRTTSFLMNWGEWKKEWDSTLLAELRVGLLHVGYNVSVGSTDWLERTLFYLDEADGYESSSNFVIEDESDNPYGGKITSGLGPVMGLADLRQKVAQKAFAMVTMNLFKPLIHERFEDEWELMRHEELFMKLLWFFRLDSSGSRLLNLRFPPRRDGKNVHAETTWDFLMKFCRFMFSFEHFGRHEDESDRVLRARLEKEWPKVVEILYCIGQTHLLLEKDFSGVLKNDACFEKLETLVMGNEIWFSDELKHRYPTTFEEAVYERSHGATTLLALRVRKTEQERRDKIHKAEEKVRKAQSALEEATRTSSSSASCKLQ